LDTRRRGGIFLSVGTSPKKKLPQDFQIKMGDEIGVMHVDPFGAFLSDPHLIIRCVT
jgi:hypothetical protein